jgi:hypothetical protein
MRGLALVLVALIASPVAWAASPPTVAPSEAACYTWVEVAPMTVARSQQTGNLLPLANYTVLQAGGVDSNGNVQQTAEIYAVPTNSWTETPLMITAHASQTGTLLSDNITVLVAGGFDGSFTSMPFCELYNSLTNTWTPTGSLITGRATQTANLLPSTGQVLVAGGYDINFNPLASAELYTVRIPIQICVIRREVYVLFCSLSRAYGPPRAP